MKKFGTACMVAFACIMLVTKTTHNASYWWVGLLIFLFLYLPEIVEFIRTRLLGLPSEENTENPS